MLTFTLYYNLYIKSHFTSAQSQKKSKTKSNSLCNSATITIITEAFHNAFISIFCYGFIIIISLTHGNKPHGHMNHVAACAHGNHHQPIDTVHTCTHARASQGHGQQAARNTRIICYMQDTIQCSCTFVEKALTRRKSDDSHGRNGGGLANRPTPLWPPASDSIGSRHSSVTATDGLAPIALATASYVHGFGAGSRTPSSCEQSRLR